MKALFLPSFLLSALSLFGQWSVDSLPFPKFQHATTANGDYVYIVGGRGDSTLSAFFNTVEVYNTNLGQWEASLPQMPLAKAFISAVHGDSALYVFGGLSSGNQNFWQGSNTVMIYKNGLWNIDTIPDSAFSSTAVKVGSKVLFAGGVRWAVLGTTNTKLSNKVYIFDELTGQWSVDTLSVPRNGILASSGGDLAIFAGGVTEDGMASDVIDIYNASTDSWSTESLSEPRVWACTVYKDGLFYVAGGMKNGLNNSSANVDLFDGVSWSQMNYQLSDPRGYISACTIGNLVIFAGGGDADLSVQDFTNSSHAIDIYNTSTNTWSINVLDHPITLHSAISNQGKAMIIGGLEWDTIPPYQYIPRKEVYIWSSPTEIEEFLSEEAFRIYPVPAKSHLTLESRKSLQTYHIEIYSAQGTLVKTAFIDDMMANINISELSPGTYFLHIKELERSFRFVKL